MPIITNVSAVARGTVGAGAALDNSEECVLVTVETDTGVIGAGEATGPVDVVCALIHDRHTWPWDRSISDLLIGRELEDPRQIFKDLYQARLWSSRSGVGHVALAGLDIAIWDAHGKIRQRPVWQLLGTSRQTPVVPYVTLYNQTESFDRGLDWTLRSIDWATEHGFRAAKIETSGDVAADDEQLVRFVETVREHVGPEFVLLVDLLYRWQTAAEAAACLQRLDNLEIFLFEAPLHPDFVGEYRKLSRLLTTPIAGLEVLSSYNEFSTLMTAGAVPILQPAITRIGITEADRLARAARRAHRRLVPFGWTATALGSAANLHLAYAHSNIPLVEYAPTELYPHMRFRATIAAPDVTPRDGLLDKPEKPGLGPNLIETDGDSDG